MTKLSLALSAVVVAALVLTASASAKTVWLCKPGIAHDPCTPSLTTTRFAASGAQLGIEHVKRAKHPKIDCFYLYPTISDQPGIEANLHIDPVQRSIALYQAAPFSRECRVYAPMYREVTIHGLFAPQGLHSLGRPDTHGYEDVLSAWRTYLRRYNHGRGVVLIGHSQAAIVFRTLVRREVERHASQRRLLVSALLTGGNVEVKKGSDVGGDFKRTRACHSPRQTGCVVAYSTFNATPPPNSLFGRTARPGREVLCTNPANLGGGSGLLDSMYPRQPFAPGSIAQGIQLLGNVVPPATTPWIEGVNSHRAACSSAAGASFLFVSPLGNVPHLHPSLDATWGLHFTDMEIAMGNLLALVHSEAAAFARRH